MRMLAYQNFSLNFLSIKVVERERGGEGLHILSLEKTIKCILPDVYVQQLSGKLVGYCELLVKSITIQIQTNKQSRNCCVRRTLIILVRSIWSLNKHSVYQCYQYLNKCFIISEHSA